ncbi:MAG: serine hydrolase domain-containing protein [Chitinophagaceae bacterium]
MKPLFILLLIVGFLQASSQALYFPPTSGTAWATLPPDSLGWCQEGIDSLYGYLEQTHTTAFMILKDGKIVLEKYFGSFTQDSVHYWASAGKSLTGMLIGIAQEKGQVNIGNTVSSYLGAGWTVEPIEKESKITLRNLLTMTSGLNDNPPAPCDNEDPSVACLQNLAGVDTGQRWAYHTGAYLQLQGVIAAASGQSINTYTTLNINNRIGMTGLWVNGVFYSKTRSMARFGLLALNRGIWANDSLLRNTAYFNSMTNTSQAFNPAYGYLWWLNGKTTYLAPGLPFTFNGSLIPKAPDDMFAALGKNDQKIYVIPSQRLVVVRTGESTYGVPLAFSPFDNLLWGKIDSLSYRCNYTFTGNGNWSVAANWEGGRIPPPQLQKLATITIKPQANGECILNVAQTINSGTNLVVTPSAKLRLLGNLDIVQH